MSELIEHIDSGGWYAFFRNEEIGHVLTSSYNLIKWIERDNADMLELKPTKITWSKNCQIVGTFSVTVPEPTPSFIETLLQIFDRDAVVQKYLEVIYEGMGVFKIKKRNI